MDKELMHNLI
jgi:hypothetical protein